MYALSDAEIALLAFVGVLAGVLICMAALVLAMFFLLIVRVSCPHSLLACDPIADAEWLSKPCCYI